MIKEFRNEYRWASNFYPSPFTFDNILYPSVEHFFQANKTTDRTIKLQIANCRTPREAKHMGSRVLLRLGWEEIKDQIMLLGLMLKFKEHPDLAKKLIKTGAEELQEGNTWGDTYWGVSLASGVGKNTLGKLLMVVRTLLKKK